MTFGITAVLSAKNLGETIGNIRGELTDIVTSQCFVEGTLIVTNEGDKPIEEIQAGDLVYSTNPETGESEYKEVLRTFRKESDVIIHIFVNGEEIETTPVHPFWVEDQWVAAKDLEVGDILTLADGTTAPITKTFGEKLDEPVIVYNFEVADFHTYYVTDTGVLVHNDNKYNDRPWIENKSNQKSNSKGKNNIHSDPNTSEPHVVYKKDPKTGQITHYTVFDSNPYSPTGLQKGISYHGIGEGHYNKATGQYVDTPHVHDPNTKGGVRKPFPDEIP